MGKPCDHQHGVARSDRGHLLFCNCFSSFNYVSLWRACGIFFTDDHHQCSAHYGECAVSSLLMTTISAPLTMESVVSSLLMTTISAPLTMESVRYLLY